jgi:PLP dependent protein
MRMSITERIAALQSIIREMEISYQRKPLSVHLLAVSKAQPVCAIEEAFAAGLCHFGENYLQEALPKIQKLAMLPLTWHFIGAIQSNKAHAVAQHFSWVHSVTSLKVAQKLHDHRLDSQTPLNVCIQINIDNETSKSGIAPDLAADLANDILQLPRLRLRGLMVIPKPLENSAQQLSSFLRVTHLLDELNTHLNRKLDTLSMGMSDDLAAAICAGSTMVRIGRGIFGQRNPQ